jgi:hypothetical protein
MKRTIWLRIVVLTLLTSVATGLALLGMHITEDWGGLWLNLGTELGGAALIYLLFERLIGQRERQETRKADLIVQLCSNVEDRATAALEQLRRQGWLYDGSLQEANLSNADLRSQDLTGADLRNSKLRGACLQEAILLNAKLQGADLTGADLVGAVLGATNSEGSEEAVAAARFDENTVLPNGTPWTPGIDVAQFTHRELLIAWW